MREIDGRFAKGHAKLGVFTKGSIHAPEAKAKISASLRNMTAEQSRAWKGQEAGYHAVHLWLTAHYDKGSVCEACGTDRASRLEWANISGEYKRERSDYKVLCPSCHRLMDINGKCRKGHPYTPESTKINSRGHR